MQITVCSPSSRRTSTHPLPPTLANNPRAAASPLHLPAAAASFPGESQARPARPVFKRRRPRAAPLTGPRGTAARSSRAAAAAAATQSPPPPSPQAGGEEGTGKGGRGGRTGLSPPPPLLPWPGGRVLSPHAARSLAASPPCCHVGSLGPSRGEAGRLRGRKSEARGRGGGGRAPA
uniref:atherin-like n=1 Tax=Podarcis muralis TaxID=64176 RepID=UPI00109F73C5|nr:atherin-like [Podarcis muralis]